jgi:hypothetical protein
LKIKQNGIEITSQEARLTSRQDWSLIREGAIALVGPRGERLLTVEFAGEDEKQALRKNAFIAL